MNYYIAQYGKRLFGLCIKLCTNLQEAEDLYQETWLKAYQYIERYDESKPFEAWITTICINTYRDMLRKNKFKHLFAQFQTNEEKDYVLQSVSTVANEEYADLKEAIRALPEKYQVLVVLHYYNGYDIKTISSVLHLSEGTVKSRLFKARSQLRRWLDDDR